MRLRAAFTEGDLAGRISFEVYTPECKLVKIETMKQLDTPALAVRSRVMTMAMELGGTASGPDVPALMSAMLAAIPETSERPARAFEHVLVERPVPGDWLDRLIGPGTEFRVEWANGTGLGRGDTTITVALPGALHDARSDLAFLEPLPFELFVHSMLQMDYWVENGYRPPAISGHHALLGWGMLFKGAGHEHSIVSRRWLDHGPFRTLHGAHDTTLVQFHDLDADGPTSLAQAKPGHAWIVRGFLRPKHRYQHDIRGVYTKADGLLRIVVNARTVSETEMVDACAARRDRGADPEKPIRNIAYVFVDEQEARAHLEALWLHALECRVADGRGERRLDENYTPTITKPAWV